MKIVYNASNSIAILSPVDQKWLDYTLTNVQANVFHHPAWMQLMEECYGYEPSIIAVIDQKGNIKAGLPIMKVNSWLTGRRIVSLPFTDHCVPLYDDQTDLLFLLDGLFEYVKQQGFQKIELRGEFPIPPKSHLSSQFALHKIQLGENSTAVLARVHPMHRRNVKIAERNGLRIEWGNSPADIRKYYNLHLQERRHQGVPVQPRRFFELLEKKIFAQDLGKILFAYQDDKVLAAMVLLRYGQTLTYKYGASLRSSLKMRPNDLLFWKAIQWGLENGFTSFDLGRTDILNTGLRAFKSRWGAEESILTYKIFGAQPTLGSNHRLDCLMGWVIRNSPLWVCRSSGELLYRHFG